MSSWYEASARQRIDALADPASFDEFIGPEEREISPHLALFDLPEQFDDGIVVGPRLEHGSTGGAVGDVVQSEQRDRHGTLDQGRLHRFHRVGVDRRQASPGGGTTIRGKLIDHGKGAHADA